VINFFIAGSLFFAAATIEEKKASLSAKSEVQEAHAVSINGRLRVLREGLEACQRKTADEGVDLSLLLKEMRELRKEQSHLEEEWRRTVAEEGRQDEEGFALWDQEETTVGQLVIEFGALDFLYIVPPEMAATKIQLHSNIPIPRESWDGFLELLLLHSGIGLKKVSPYAKQLFPLKQDLSAIGAVVSKREALSWHAGMDRLFYLLSPPVEQVRSVFQFFEKFSDAKQTFIHQIGGKIAIVATKDEIEKLLTLYDTVWQEGGRISKVISVGKMSVREMEKILGSFFAEALDKGRLPFGRNEPQEGLSIFPLAQSNTLVLVGAKEVVDRAERIVRETEEQLEDPAEMTVFLYTCRHTNPADLAKVLDQVYISLLTSGQEGPTRETEISYGAQGAPGKIPDGYPPLPPLVVAPPPLKPGISSHLEIEQGHPDHFIPDPKTGTLLMTVRRDVLAKIKDLLKYLDVPKKMVQIEVLLFERRLNSQNNFGLNLLKLGKSKNGLTYTPAFGPEVGAKGILQFFFHGPAHKYTPHFDIAYNFLMTQQDIQLNAAPSVTTVNQTPATISIVEEISINNGAAPVDTNKGTTFEKSFARAQYGITIVLTPTIHAPSDGDEKGCVTLQTNISFDTTKPHPDDRPLVDRRHIENEVRVVDGETIILGGLRRKSKQDHEEKIPFLGEIPGFGKLFGSTELTDHDTEMFFFITPKIIDDPKQDMIAIRTEELKKRPGDLPEFLQRAEEARDKEKSRYFRQSMQLFFKHDR
jgi:general secretion pathway protein D